MPGDNFIVGVDYSDKGTAQLFIGVTHRLEESAVRRLLQTFFHQIT